MAALVAGVKLLGYAYQAYKVYQIYEAGDKVYKVCCNKDAQFADYLDAGVQGVFAVAQVGA